MALAPPANVFEKHNHRQCLTGGMKGARSFCQAKGLRLTPVRARVLEILLENHRAMGAYEILERLNSEDLGRQPPVVYRALDFLVANGFVHKLERLNAFAACCQPELGHQPMFLICQDCSQVAEMPIGQLGLQIDQSADILGFQVTSHVIELLGSCAACQEG